MTPQRYILLGFGIAVAIMLGFLVGQRCPRESQGEPVTIKVDTLVIRDTIVSYKPKWTTRRVVDSIPYPVGDTIRLRDTLWMYLEKEQVTWEDSLSRVYASGIDPHVDSVVHFTQEQLIIKEIPVIKVKKTRWGIGIQGGVAADKDGVIPYVGVGVSYNILSW